MTEIVVEEIDPRIIVKKKSNKRYINGVDMHNSLVEFYNAVEDKPNTPIPDYIGRCILQIATNLSSKINFSSYCVDEDTQALCKRGWLFYNEITFDDEILSLNPNTNDLVWSKIKDYYINDYNDFMFHLTGSTIDALVTPNHKFLTLEKGLVQVQHLSTKDHLITMGNAEEFQEEIYPDYIVELIGWIVTEGNYSQYLKKKDKIISYCINISQNQIANPEKCDRIRNCLKQYIGQEYSEYIDREQKITFRIPVSYSKLFVDIVPHKILTYDFIMQLSRRQRELLIDVMIMADGSVCGIRNENRQFFQKDKASIDSFLFLCTLCGITTDTHYREWKTKFCISKGYTVTLTNKPQNKQCLLEKVDFHGAERNHGGDQTKNERKATIPYKGKIWCPQTEYGNFVCRRGKKIYVTGNTFKEEMVGDAITKMMEAVVDQKYDANISNNPFAYFSQIAWNSFLQRIAKEKKESYIIHKNLDNLFLHEDLHIDEEDYRYINGVLTDDNHNRIIETFEKPKEKNNYAGHKNLSYKPNREKKGRRNMIQPAVNKTVDNSSEI